MIETTTETGYMQVQDHLALAALAARDGVMGGEYSDPDIKFSDDETRKEGISSSASSYPHTDVQQAKLERFATQWEAFVEQLVPQYAIVTLSVSNVTGGVGKLILSDQTLALYDSIETLESYRELRAGWNGKGSTSFDGELIDSAIDFVKQLDYQPEIFPTGRDTIQFEYHTDRGYLEVEVGLFDLSVFIETETEQIEKDNVTVEQAITMIRDFHAQR